MLTIPFWQEEKSRKFKGSKKGLLLVFPKPHRQPRENKTFFPHSRTKFDNKKLTETYFLFLRRYFTEGLRTIENFGSYIEDLSQKLGHIHTEHEEEKKALKEALDRRGTMEATTEQVAELTAFLIAKNPDDFAGASFDDQGALIE